MNEVKRGVSLNQFLLWVRFLLPVFILVLAMVGLRPGLGALSLYYAKETIAILRPLKEFDVSCLPSFRDGWIRSDMPPDDIGTKEYLCLKLVREKRESGKPQQVALFITYYSVPGDKVPHTPDVCYRQGGAIVKKMTTIEIETPELAPEYPQIDGRLLLLKMPVNNNRVVIYCFCVEGQIRHTREQVRIALGKPGNSYTYFSKIEAVTTYPVDGDPTEAIALCKTLLAEAFPILLTEYFPDKKQIKRY